MTLRSLAILGGSVTTAGLLALAGVRLHSAFLPAGEVLPGLTIDHRAVEGSVAQAVADASRARLSQKVHFTIDDVTVVDASLADLGVSVDEARTADIARAVGHEGDLVSRADLAKRAGRGEIDVPLAMRVDSSHLVALLAPVKELNDHAPTSARVDFDHGGAKAEAPGRYVDVDLAIADLAKIATAPTSAEARVVALSTRAFAPHLVGSAVRDIDVSQTLSSFDTFFSRSGDQSRRGKNIDVAASKLDGLVLMPNELVSFNDVVGARSEDNGFSKSWEIFKGEMVEGVGGGTCQVASTLHATAFFGGLDIVERLPHSRPSAYIPMGLDATVVFPVVDMKLKNPYAFPVVVHATSEGPRLHMELRGKKRLARVTFSREVKRVLPYDRKVEEKQGVSHARVIVKQHGVDGFKIERKRVVEFFDGEKREEKENDTYPPTNEVLEVAPGFDVSLLPPLPEPPPADPTEVSPPPTVATTTPTTTPLGVEGYVMQDAPGAHQPTQAQQNPELLVTIKR